MEIILHYLIVDILRFLNKLISKKNRIKILNLISIYTPDIKKIWIFSSRDGIRYNGNTKHLYEYININHKNITAVWFTKNQDVYDYLISKKYNVCMTYSIKGFLLSMFAGVAFVNIDKYCLNYEVLGRTPIVQLWHGMPLKEIKISLNKFYVYKIKRSWFYKLLFKTNNSMYQMLTVTMPELNEQFSKRDGIDINTIKVTGYPRTDIFFSDQRIMKIEQLKKKYGWKNIILYLPTYRDILQNDGRSKIRSSYDLFNQYDFDIKKIEYIMKKYNSVLLIKLHPLQFFEDKELYRKILNSSYFHLIDSQDPLEDEFEYLKYTDILITDYSSVYFEYLLMNRPIIFSPFDYKSYVTNRPLGFSYEDVTPGPKTKNWSEVADNLQNILSGSDDYYAFRKKVCERFNVYQDGKSSERVFKEVEKLIA